MLTIEIMDRYSQFLVLMSHLLKVLVMTVLALLAISAIAAPDFVMGRLERLGLKIKEIDAGFVKLVATEATKAGANTLQIAEALTETELQLRKIGTAGPPSGAANATASIDDALKTILVARAALDEQSTAIQESGKAAGVTANVPTKGWLYVGLFGDNGEAKLVSDRIGSKDGLKYAERKLESIVLRFDAGVVSDGDACTKTKAVDFVPPDPKEPERQYAVLRASPEPLKVIATKSCVTPASVKSVYAQIEVPKGRVRFSTLSSLPQSEGKAR